MRSILTHFLTSHNPSAIMAISIKLKISSLPITLLIDILFLRIFFLADQTCEEECQARQKVLNGIHERISVEVPNPNNRRYCICRHPRQRQLQSPQPTRQPRYKGIYRCFLFSSQLLLVFFNFVDKEGVGNNGVRYRFSNHLFRFFVAKICGSRIFLIVNL